MRSAIRRWLAQESLWLLLAAACLGIAYLVTQIGAAIVDGVMAGADRAVRTWILEHHAPAILLFFGVVTNLGAKELLVPVSVIVGWRLFRENRGWIALLAYAVLVSAEFAGVVKRDVRLLRPEGGIEADMGFSFPSGHAAGSAGFAILLAYVAVRRGLRARVVVPLAALYVALVGLSRVYLDLHWASDVLGGWLIGATFGVGCCAVYEWIQRRAEAAANRVLTESATN